MTTQTQVLASEMKPPAKEAWDSAAYYGTADVSRQAEHAR